MVKPFSPRSSKSTGLTALLAAAMAATACSSSSPSDTDEVKVGLLLPFTGADSATSGNFERAVLFAKDRVNAAGGVGGRRIRVISADTHSDLTRGKTSAQSLIDAGVSVVIGAESADLASIIKQELQDAGVVFLSPLVGASNDQTVDCNNGPWFRLAPSARALGEALAKRAYADGVRQAGLFNSGDAYDNAMTVAFDSRFRSLGGTKVFGTSADSPDITADQLAQTQALLLAAPPRSAALLVNDLRFLTHSQLHWYFSPLLKTDLFVENVAPGALEGGIGVTPQIFDTGEAFPSAFAARWEGDQPLDGAYFYFDAMTLLAFGFQKALATDATTLDAAPADRAAALQKAILSVVGPNGQSAKWTDVDRALPRVGAGEAVYYTGLTGPLLFVPCGDRLAGASSPWQVNMGKIQE
jgi:ABC-type branched-subunit amino acid transport system substrate-binding protein